MEIAEALTAPASGPTPTGSQAQTLAYARISTNQKAWAEALRTRLPRDRTSAYLWLSLACGTYSSSLPDSDNREAVVGEARAATIVAFKEAASCARGSSAPLQRILDHQPRFQEVQYLQRHADVIAITDELIAINVTVSDARYWRALNERAARASA